MALDQFFEHIQKHLHDQLPFVAYKKPNTSTIKGAFQNNDKLYTTADFTESGFVFAPFDSENDAILIPFDHATIIEQEVVLTDESEISMPTDEAYKQYKRFHVQLVKKGIAAIQNQDLKKVVLSRREKVENSANDPIHLFEKLLKTYTTAFVYCWYHPEVGLWLGATPETLLSIKGNQLTTMALAGTQAFEGSMDVFWKEKEKGEQQLVTDFLIDSLQPSLTGKTQSGESSVGQIQVSEVETVKAGNLLHLKTIIRANLKPGTLNLKQLLTAIHPTPAVCGFPKERAKAFILEHEDYPREFYAGFLGELHLKQTTTRNTNRRNVENNAYGVSKTVSNLYVNLRCMQIKDEQVYIYVGGGITKDSDAEMEWEETVHKSQIIKRVL